MGYYSVIGHSSGNVAADAATVSLDFGHALDQGTLVVVQLWVGSDDGTFASTDLDLEGDWEVFNPLQRVLISGFDDEIPFDYGDPTWHQAFVLWSQAGDSSSSWELSVPGATALAWRTYTVITDYWDKGEWELVLDASTKTAVGSTTTWVTADDTRTVDLATNVDFVHDKVRPWGYVTVATGMFSVLRDKAGSGGFLTRFRTAANQVVEAENQTPGGALRPFSIDLARIWGSWGSAISSGLVEQPMSFPNGTYDNLDSKSFDRRLFPLDGASPSQALSLLVWRHIESDQAEPVPPVPVSPDRQAYASKHAAARELPHYLDTGLLRGADLKELFDG